MVGVWDAFTKVILKMKPINSKLGQIDQMLWTTAKGSWKSRDYGSTY